MRLMMAWVLIAAVAAGARAEVRAVPAAELLAALVEDGQGFPAGPVDPVLLPDPADRNGPGGLGGTDWLKWWEDRHSEWQLRAAWLFMFRPQAQDVEAAIAAYGASVAGAGTTLAKVELLMKCIRDRYRNDPSKVCRHHAMLLYKVAPRVGIPVWYRCYAYGVGLSRGHSWNRVQVDGKVFVVDAFNGIQYELR
jgi:hypothetical protein